MPARDGTGPNGQGARTGRGLGNYSGQGGTENGYGDRRGLKGQGGRGMGRGMGGRGMGINARQGNFRWQAQLSDLQAAIEKLMTRLGRHKEVN